MTVLTAQPSPPNPLQNFKDIAAASGSSSQERKKGHVVKLLVASKGNETGYIMRSLQVGGEFGFDVCMK